MASTRFGIGSDYRSGDGSGAQIALDHRRYMCGPHKYRTTLEIQIRVVRGKRSNYPDIAAEADRCVEPWGVYIGACDGIMLEANGRQARPLRHLIYCSADYPVKAATFVVTQPKGVSPGDPEPRRTRNGAANHHCALVYGYRKNRKVRIAGAK